MKDLIIKAAVEEFDENGIQFTMDDLAGRLGVSKRTIYENIGSKEEIILQIIESTFGDIKDQERKIVGNQTMDILEKIRNVVCILPANFPFIDYRKISEINKFYPDLYRKIEEHLSSDWDVTLSLFQKAIDEKKLKPVNLHLVRQMILGMLKSALDAKFLMNIPKTIGEVQFEMMDVLLYGLAEDRRKQD